MKRKDWRKEQEDFDPMRGSAIKCPAGGKLIGYEKDFMHMVISPPGIVCSGCNEIVIRAPNVTCHAYPSALNVAG